MPPKCRIQDSGWKSTDPPCLLCAVWASEAKLPAPSRVCSAGQATQPESSPARRRAAVCRWARCDRWVLLTGLGCSGP